MSWVGIEPMIPASEPAKTVHALDRSATVTGDWANACRVYVEFDDGREVAVVSEEGAQH
jgi:hypothetical protein